MSEKTFTVRCVECGRTAQSTEPIPYWLCESCKVKLEASNRKRLMEHLSKAAKENKGVIHR